MKFFITKYALTRGIIEVEGMASLYNPSTLIAKGKYGEIYNYHKEENEWHKTNDTAIVKAEKMRLHKIKLLEKQIKKLKLIKFE